MKAKFVPIILFGLLSTVDVFAAPPACSTTQQLTAAQIKNLLGNKTLCASTSTEKWQEFHEGNNNGNLIDFKKGASDPVDPTTTVGSWSTTNSDTLVHTYGGTSYSWSVFDNCDNTSYRLVGTGTYIFTVINGGPTACP